ncbi:hypothetical protein ACFL3Q_12375 [Planctomycetota bacterium]
MALDTVAGLFSRVQLNLGRGAQATIVASIPEWANLEQRELCRQGKWWFNFAEFSGTTLAQADDTLTLPDDFIDDCYVYLEDTNGELYEVKLMEDQEYRDFYTDLTGTNYQARPKHYLLRESDILFRPIADASYIVHLGYFKQLADLVSGGATNELLLSYPDILEAGATYRGFQYMQQYQDAQYWKGIRDEYLSKLRMANAEREFPDEMVLNVRPGAKTSRIRGKTRRIGPNRYYPRKGY